jgi:hypothetical protein
MLALLRICWAIPKALRPSRYMPVFSSCSTRPFISNVKQLVTADLKFSRQERCRWIDAVFGQDFQQVECLNKSLITGCVKFSTHGDPHFKRGPVNEFQQKNAVFD